MTQYLRILGALVLAALMTACGGGGGSPGSTSGSNGSSSTPGGTATLTVTDLALFTDKTTINNNGTDKAQVTVVAVDKNRNVVSGASVTVNTDQNAVFTPSGTLTDTTGSYVGNLTIGSDKSDRDVTLTVTSNGVTKQTTVRVTGSKLLLRAVPPSPSPGQSVVLTASLQDSSNNPVQNVPVTLGGTIPALQNQVIVTGTLGTATKSFVAPAVPGIYTITANGNGVSAGDYQLQVFSTVIPAAVIPSNAAPSLAASPNVLAVNSPGQTANKSTIRFLFVDPSNTPVPNVRVRFDDITTGLPKVGSSITSGSSTVYTDATGVATTQYVSGQNFSPTNGVTIRACYSAVDFVSSTDCPKSVNVSLTIAGQALAVSIGDDNLLEASKGGLTYIKRFVVSVADSAGKPVPNAPVDISVDLTHYGKGTFTYPYVLNGTIVQPLQVVPQDLLAAYPSFTADPNTSVTGTATATIPSTGTGTSTISTISTVIAQGQRVWCPNEDFNRNGNVDPGENYNNSVDTNGQPTLEPRKSDLIVSYDVPTVTTTDSGGLLVIKVEYAQRFATWLAYRVRVTANVAGSQGMAERLFVTSFIKGDDTNGGAFLNPAYGFNSCVSPN